jgi:hypothetical protein
VEGAWRFRFSAVDIGKRNEGSQERKQRRLPNIMPQESNLPLRLNKGASDDMCERRGMYKEWRNTNGSRKEGSI